MLARRPTAEAVVDSHIRLDTSDLPSELVRKLTDSLTLPNLEKEKALRLGTRGAQRLPDNLFLYAMMGNHLLMPRGYAHRLVSRMDKMSYDIEWEDKRVSIPFSDSYRVQVKEPVLYAHQEAMVQTITKREQGILQVNPGTGKTVVCLEAIRRLGQRALVLIHKKEIAGQWQERCEQFLGVPMGFIGDNVWQEEEITIALIQTLHSRKDQLARDNWYANWGLVCLDEAHNSTGDTRVGVLQRFPSRYLFGLSATPGKTDLRIAEIMLGPAKRPISVDELYERGILVKPKIYGVMTKFWSHPSTPYMKLEAQLRDDHDRNALIASKVIEQEGSCQLVTSRVKGQLREIRYMCEQAGMERLWMMTGDESLERRMEIAHAAADGNCVIFSTIADEALDIPRLERLHLACPYRNPDLVIQLVGRIQRPHPEKHTAIVYDYRDTPGPLARQWQYRLNEVYRPSEWPVEIINRELVAT
jgi:superfamily II DNA or RNA helicase